MIAGVTAWDWTPAQRDATLADTIAKLAEADLCAAFQLKQKQARSETIDKIWQRVFAKSVSARKVVQMRKRSRKPALPRIENRAFPDS